MIPQYIKYRLDKLAELKDGWYGGHEEVGRAISSETMKRAMERFDNYRGPHVYLYPTVDGFISVEYDDPDRDEVIE